MSEQYIVGRNPILEILRTDRHVDTIFIAEGESRGSINRIMDIARDRNIRIERVNKGRLDRISGTNAHQGVAALVGPYEYSSVDGILNIAAKRDEPPFILILDGIEDPHNLGAIIRSAEAGGAHGIIIPKRRAAQVTQTVYKSSAGSVEFLAIARVTNISNTIDNLKEKGLWIYGADMDGRKNHFDWDLSGPVGLVIGSEGRGISRLVGEKCDALLRIPIRGRTSSLNAANAASILIYEVVRQNYGGQG
ncbi:MAG: 23S rRNA (guanosine(2251)-2'-O)-methyltransferase RlmB [Tissierellia bacterium]|nr:23S rRNA (guanosine(2251)-2'-O)-methyltransferase RlmB [Tissierellia bacterium]